MSLLDNASLLLTPNAYKEGKLYSVIPSNGNGDFTATRATTATRVNAAGLVDLVPYNLLTYSEQFENAAWVKTRATITANTTLAPNATLTADSLIQSSGQTSRGFISTANISILGAVTYSIYAKKNTKDFVILTDNALGLGFENSWFNINTGTLGTIAVGRTASITSVGDGWYRCSITVNVTLLPSQYLFGLADTNNSTTVVDSGGIFLWGAQLVEGTSARDYLRTETRLNIPRLDYSLGGCPNILLEPQRTNLALQSSSFDSVSWAKVSVTISANNTTSPSGVADADKMIENVGSSSKYVSGSSYPANTYTASIYVKPSNKTFFWMSLDSSVSAVFFNLTTGTIAATGVGNTGTIASVGNGWFRCTITRTNAISHNLLLGTSDSSANYISNGNGVDGVFLWGAQIEAGAYATSFIPTTTASVTRNADSITRNNIFTNGLITAAGGTWFVELRGNVAIQRDSATQGIFINTGTSATIGNGITIRNLGGLVRNSIVKIISGTATTIYTTTSNTCKIAIKWNGTTADVFENGVKVVSATSFTPTAMQNLIGDGSALTLNLNEMALFPTPLTDTQCIALTA